MNHQKSGQIYFLCTTCLSLAIVSFNVNSAVVSGQGTWETTMQARDFDGDTSTIEGYYDTVQDITWLADANYAQTSGFDADGRMNWDAMLTWVLSLNINGITGWSIPTVRPINAGVLGPFDGGSYNVSFSNNATTDWGYADNAGWVDGFGNPASQLGYMYYVTLGNLGFCTPDNVDPSSCVEQAGWGISNTGPFANIQPVYWTSGSSVPPGLNTLEWDFRFDWGRQSALDKNNFLYAWVKHNGSVGTAVVPIPPALWLFGSGLLGLIGVARRKKSLLCKG